MHQTYFCTPYILCRLSQQRSPLSCGHRRHRRLCYPASCTDFATASPITFHFGSFPVAWVSGLYEPAHRYKIELRPHTTTHTPLASRELVHQRAPDWIQDCLYDSAHRHSLSRTPSFPRSLFRVYCPWVAMNFKLVATLQVVATRKSRSFVTIAISKIVADQRCSLQWSCSRQSLFCSCSSR